MPTYEYRCTKGHNFEITQSMTDEPRTRCGKCGAKVQRVFHPVAVHFKGSGFYTTDYGKNKRGESKSEASSNGSSGSDSEGSSEKKAKPEKKEKAAKD